MPKLAYTEAFARYGASLHNERWAFSAMAPDGSLVLSCWEHYLKPFGAGVLRFADAVSRRQNKKLGLTLLIEHLTAAQENNLDIRLVIAYTEETDVVDEGRGAGRIKKDFDVRPDLVGKLVEFDGDRYVIDFRRRA
jgi:hypothetical protein